MQFDFSFGQPRARSPADSPEDAPLRILVMGDFSGREQRAQCDSSTIATRPLLKIDVDNFDQVLRRMAPAMRVPAASVSATDGLIEFRSLDDFHPDRLYRDLVLFRRFSEMRARLLDPASFAQAAAELGLAASSAAASPTASPGARTEGASREADAAMLERLLGSKPTTASAATQGADQGPIDALLRRVVAPHIKPDAPAFQQAYLASVDAAAGQALRALLHLPQWQALESAWRGVHWLMSNLELGEQIELYLCDIARTELNADLARSEGDPERTSLYRRLVEDPGRDSEAQSWSLIVGLYSFERTSDDAQMLGVLGAIASQAGGPFVAAAAPSLVGCSAWPEMSDPRQWHIPEDDSARDWRALRESGVAAWIGLVLPRILLRLPYGAKTEPIDSFAFEELSSGAGHEAYLWGNSALACALLLGQSFQEREWDMEPGERLDIGELPAHIVEIDAEKRMQACAEVFLTEHAAEAILRQGPMPVMSFRNRNAVRVLRFQSIASPVMALRGPWAAR